MNNLYDQKIIDVNNLFDNSMIDSKMLYMYKFNILPSVSFVGDIDGEKAFNAISEKFKELTNNKFEFNHFDKKKKKFSFGNVILVLKGNCILECSNSYIEILHNNKQDDLLKEITDIAMQFKERRKRDPLEINVVIPDRNSLQLRCMEIKRTKLDLGLYYEDDFKETDELIRSRLTKRNDKGIVLLHGLPGTGKTTYLRYLIGKIKKRVLILSPSVAGNIMNPEFIELLIDNPNTVLIIEDAENIIMDRKLNTGSSVSNLLNISDGLMADFLNVQLICTFNSSLTMIDSALLRKGRLIAKYEFGKLGVGKSQRLSDHLGFDTKIHRPMTIAEIANQHEREQKEDRIEIAGFRSALLEN